MSAPHAPQRPATVDVDVDLDALRRLANRLADLDAGAPSAVNLSGAPGSGRGPSSSTASKRSAPAAPPGARARHTSW